MRLQPRHPLTTDQEKQMWMLLSGQNLPAFQAAQHQSAMKRRIRSSAAATALTLLMRPV
jgi:hypothetical protein